MFARLTLTAALIFGATAVHAQDALDAVQSSDATGAFFGAETSSPSPRTNSVGVVTITAPSSASYTSTAIDGSITVQGTATGSPSSVAWSRSGGSGACTGTTSWSCVVSLARGTTQTITVAATYAGGSSTDTIDIVEPTSWLADFSAAAVTVDPCVTSTFITAKGTAAPVSCSRGTATYRDSISSGVRTITSVGSNVLRIVSRPDSGSTTRTGLLGESSSTNLVFPSRDLSAWTKIDAGDSVSTDSVVGPDGASTMDGWIADSTDGPHGASQAPTLTATTHTASAWFKAGSQGWAYISDDTVANAFGYFNLSTCAAGTKGAGATQLHSENWGNGLCRVGVTFTGNVAAHTIKFSCAQADNDNAFAGDGATVACSITRMQVEAKPFMSSSIDTSAGTSTRNADFLRYPGASNFPSASAGAVYTEFLRPSVLAASPAQAYLWTFTQAAGASANAFFGSVDSSHHLQFTNNAGGVTQLNVTDLRVNANNNALQKSLVRFDTNAGHAMMNNLESATADTSGSLTTSIDRLYIASRETGTINADAVISKIVIQDVVPARGIECLGDSITLGNHITTPWPMNLAASMETEGYTVRNDGVGGNTTTQMVARFSTTGQLYSHLVLMGGVNDLAAGTVATSIETNLASLIATARAASLKIVLITVTPWKSSAGWTAGKQAETETLNVWIRAQAAADLVVLDEYAQMNDAGNDGHLTAACDSGDAIHPSQTCSDAMGVRIFNALMALR